MESERALSTSVRLGAQLVQTATTSLVSSANQRTPATNGALLRRDVTRMLTSFAGVTATLVSDGNRDASREPRRIRLMKGARAMRAGAVVMSLADWTMLHYDPVAAQEPGWKVICAPSSTLSPRGRSPARLQR